MKWARAAKRATAIPGAALYRTDLDDDIQFISSGGGAATNAGFFQNVGKTRRQGFDLAASGKWRALGLSARYGFVDATIKLLFLKTAQSVPAPTRPAPSLCAAATEYRAFRAIRSSYG